MPATIVRVTIRVDPADAQTVIDAIAECWTELSLEPELLYYDASQSVTDPGTFYQVELWARDAEYLQNIQSKAPFYGVFYQRTGHLWKEDRKIEFGNRLPQFNILRPDGVRSAR